MLYTKILYNSHLFKTSEYSFYIKYSLIFWGIIKTIYYIDINFKSRREIFEKVFKKYNLFFWQISYSDNMFSRINVHI